MYYLGWHLRGQQEFYCACRIETAEGIELEIYFKKCCLFRFAPWQSAEKVFFNPFDPPLLGEY